MKTPGQEAFAKACDMLKGEGANVVAVIATYDKDDAHFSTKLSVHENKELGLSETHIVLDAMKKIANMCWDCLITLKFSDDTSVGDEEAVDRVRKYLEGWSLRAHK